MQITLNWSVSLNGTRKNLKVLSLLLITNCSFHLGGYETLEAILEDRKLYLEVSYCFAAKNTRVRMQHSVADRRNTLPLKLQVKIMFISN